jgi:hypothetical protein
MNIQYPHLYEITNERSAKNQWYFLNGVRAEYALLIFTAVNSSLSYDGKYITNLALFILLIILLLVRNVINFEQKWYKYRAVTESIKTTTWKFAMKAEPFNGDEETHNAKQYVEYLKNILIHYESSKIRPSCARAVPHGQFAEQSGRFGIRGQAVSRPCESDR